MDKTREKSAEDHGLFRKYFDGKGVMKKADEIILSDYCKYKSFSTGEEMVAAKAGEAVAHSSSPLSQDGIHSGRISPIEDQDVFPVIVGNKSILLNAKNVESKIPEAMELVKYHPCKNTYLSQEAICLENNSSQDQSDLLLYDKCRNKSLADALSMKNEFSVQSNFVDGNENTIINKPNELEKSKYGSTIMQKNICYLEKDQAVLFGGNFRGRLPYFSDSGNRECFTESFSNYGKAEASATISETNRNDIIMENNGNPYFMATSCAKKESFPSQWHESHGQKNSTVSYQSLGKLFWKVSERISEKLPVIEQSCKTFGRIKWGAPNVVDVLENIMSSARNKKVISSSNAMNEQTFDKMDVYHCFDFKESMSKWETHTQVSVHNSLPWWRNVKRVNLPNSSSYGKSFEFQETTFNQHLWKLEDVQARGSIHKKCPSTITSDFEGRQIINTELDCKEKSISENNGDMNNQKQDDPKFENEVETEVNESSMGTPIKNNPANGRESSSLKNDPMIITGVISPKFQAEMKPKFDLDLKISSQENSDAKPRDSFENKFEGQCLGETSSGIHHCQESNTMHKDYCGFASYRDTVAQQVEEAGCDGKETICELTHERKSKNFCDQENEANPIEMEDSIDLPKEEKTCNYDLHRIVDDILAKNCYVLDVSKVSCARQILERIESTIGINDTNDSKKETQIMIESEILTPSTEVKVKKMDGYEQIKNDCDTSESKCRVRSETAKQGTVVQVMKGGNEEQLYEDGLDARDIESEIKDADSFSNQNTCQQNLDEVTVEKVENKFDGSNKQECDANEQDLHGLKKLGNVYSHTGEIVAVEESVTIDLAGHTFCKEKSLEGALFHKERGLGKGIDLLDDEMDQRAKYFSGAPKCCNMSNSENAQDTMNECATTGVKVTVSCSKEITSTHKTLVQNEVNDEEMERANSFNCLRTAPNGEVVLNDDEHARDDNLPMGTENTQLDGMEFCPGKEPSQENEPNDVVVKGFIEAKETNFKSELSQMVHESLANDPNSIAKDLRLPVDVLEEGKNFIEIISNECKNQDRIDEPEAKTAHEEKKEQIRFEGEMSVEEINMSDDVGMITEESVAVGENEMGEIEEMAECTVKDVLNQNSIVQHLTNDTHVVHSMDVIETVTGVSKEGSIHSDFMGHHGDMFSIPDNEHVSRKYFTIKGDDCIRILKTKMEIEYWSIGSGSLRSCGHEGGEIKQLCELVGDRTDFKQMTKLKCYRNHDTISSKPLEIMSSADVSVIDEDKERCNSNQVRACNAFDHDGSLGNLPNNDFESLDMSNQAVDFSQTDTKGMAGINEDSQDIFRSSMCLEWGLDDVLKSHDLPMESPKVLDLSLDLSSHGSESSKLVAFVNNLDRNEESFSIRNKYSLQTPSFERRENTRYIPSAFSLSEVDDFSCEYDTDKESCIYGERSCVPPAKIGICEKKLVENNFGHDSKTCAPLGISFLGSSKLNSMSGIDGFENYSENHSGDNDVDCGSNLVTSVSKDMIGNSSNTKDCVSPAFCYVGSEKDDHFNEMKAISPFQMHWGITKTIETPEKKDDYQVVPKVKTNEDLENKSFESILSRQENGNVVLDSTEQKVNDVIDDKDDTSGTFSLDAYLDTIVNKRLISEGKEDCIGSENSSQSCLNCSNKECQTQLCGLLNTIHSCECLESLLLSPGELEICQSRGKKRMLQALNLEAVATRKRIKYTPAVDVDTSDMAGRPTAPGEKSDLILNDERNTPSKVQSKSPEHLGNESKVKSMDHLKILELHEQDWEGMEDEVVRKDCVDQEVPSATIQEDYMKGRKHEDINDDGMNHVNPVNARKESSVSNLACGSKVLLRIGLSKRAKLPRLHHKI